MWFSSDCPLKSIDKYVEPWALPVFLLFWASFMRPFLRQFFYYSLFSVNDCNLFLGFWYSFLVVVVVDYQCNEKKGLSFCCLSFPTSELNKIFSTFDVISKMWWKWRVKWSEKKILLRFSSFLVKTFFVWKMKINSKSVLLFPVLCLWLWTAL